MTTSKDRQQQAQPAPSEALVFPTTYELKVVVELDRQTGASKQEIERMLLRLKIPFSFLEVKLSSRQSYVSHSIRVTLLDKEQMDSLYRELKQIPGIKFAL
ncbi:MAG: DUF493 domain-containing protein [Bacteroidales bacterium]|nr:DUF493 domain-containing protein [Bacteroidales bacterium]